MTRSGPGEPSVEALRARFDVVLDEFLAEQRTLLAQADPAAGTLTNELRLVIAAGGKRLRPMFCYWGHRAAGGADGEPIVRAAASLELLHTFAIIHDDVMDRSPLRRGRPATHLVLERGDAHAGISAAILAGDLAFALADELFGDSGFSPERILAGFRWYNRMRAEVIAGQHLDLESSRGPVPAEATVRRIAAMKSGAYTVEKPLLIGSALAGGSPDLEGALSTFGAPLGEAFQLRDDVLGAFGDPAVTGKDAEGDLREGKRTLLVTRAVEAASPAEREFLERSLGRADLSASDAEAIREIFRSTGALASTVELVDRLHEEALSALEKAGLNAAVAAALAELAGLAVVRES